MTQLLFFFNDTATTEIYTLSLHDALPISGRRGRQPPPPPVGARRPAGGRQGRRAARAYGPRGAGRRHPRLPLDRKSTRLNSSHANISYAVFCLKKKNTTDPHASLGPSRHA